MKPLGPLRFLPDMSYLIYRVWSLEWWPLWFIKEDRVRQLLHLSAWLLVCMGVYIYVNASKEYSEGPSQILKSRNAFNLYRDIFGVYCLEREDISRYFR